MSKRIALIVGARPNFMKIAPILHALESYPEIDPVLIHTGQHYDAQLSDVFFDELGIKPPDLSLNVGSGTHGKQTGQILEAVEAELMKADSDGNPYQQMVVVGDVNSTMAAAIAAAKMFIPVAHVEAGLRSRDRSMPEEINRILTDSITDLLLCSEPEGVSNLLEEGHPEENIKLVGNVMIDTLLKQVEIAKAGNTLADHSLEAGQYGVVTMHRPANVDDEPILTALLDVLLEISEHMQFVFPIHPRTRARLESFGLLEKLEAAPNISCLGPLGYNDFLCLTSQSKVIVTDSGGLQEESTALGVPCLTMRPNTERPITVTEGTSVLVGNDAAKLKKHLNEVLSGTYKQGRCPELWDGKAAVRIAEILAGSLANPN